jgi:3-oxoadipate enol-lactonase
MPCDGTPDVEEHPQMSRWKIGRQEFARATAGTGFGPVDRVRTTSPALADGITEFVYGDLFARSGMAARERELLTVAVLATLGGNESQLSIHVPAALECGVDPDELVIMCEQIAPYAGFPRALNALRVVRAVLEERGLPLPLPVDRVVLRDHSTFVSDSGGPGPALVLIHPLGLDRLMWRDLARALAPHRRVITYDLRWHGGAAAAPTGPDGGVFLRDLHEVLEACEVERFELVGLGTGATIAAAFATAHRERLDGLALVAPLEGDTPEIARVRDESHYRMPKARIGELLPLLFRPESLAENGWGVRYVRDRLQRAGVDDWSASWTALAALHDRLDLTGDLGAPVRVVTAEGDRFAPAQGARRIAAELGASEFDVIPRAAHMVALEQPEWLRQSLGLRLTAPVG